MDLDRTATILWSAYSTRGAPAWDPLMLLRALILGMVEGFTGFGALVAALRKNAVYRLLVGLSLSGDVPGRTTFYDFFGRLPGFREAALRERRKARNRRRGPKPKKKYKKGEKAPPKHPGITVKLGQLRGSGRLPRADELTDFLNLLLWEGFVEESRRRDLFEGDLLHASGDSTDFPVHASPYGHRTCQCPVGEDCPHPRQHSAPEAVWGWTSHQGRWYYGYRFYELTSAKGAELPFYIEMPKASRHDSVTGYLTLAHFTAAHPLASARLDSAHDNPPTYSLIRAMGGIPFIDLNRGTVTDKEGNLKKIADEAHGLSPKGEPVCDWGPMVYRGRSGRYQRFDCPTTRAWTEAKCWEDCYRCTSHVKVADNPRLVCEVPRSRQEWKDEYDRRTTVERSHQRKKNDFRLTARKNRQRPLVFALYVVAAFTQHALEWAKAVDGHALLDAWLEVSLVA